MEEGVMIKKQKVDELEPRLHNKSGLTCLSIMLFKDDWIKMINQRVLKPCKKELIQGLASEMCQTIMAKDGRLSIPNTYLNDKDAYNSPDSYNEYLKRMSKQTSKDRGSQKPFYAYQLVAFLKFGREKMESIPASKKQTDLVISHLCGTRNCIKDTHIIIENKQINDERTHCHHCLTVAYKTNDLRGVILFRDSGACNHNPPCYSLYKLS